MSGPTRTIASNLLPDLGGTSSVTPLLDPQLVASRAASIRQSWSQNFLPDFFGGSGPQQSQTPTLADSGLWTSQPQNMSPMGFPYQTQFPTTGGYPTNPQAPATQTGFSAFIDDLVAQQKALEEQRQQAIQLGAQLATASYDAQLNVIGGQLDRLRAAQGRVDQQWADWEKEATAAITAAASTAQQAYASYIDMINKGYNEYDALTQSRYGEYQQQVKSLINQYMKTTNKSYREFRDALPGIWQPVIDAVASGNSEALGAIAADAAAARDSVVGSVVQATDQFQSELNRIGADNPALADELLKDLHDTTALVIESVNSNESHTALIQQASADLASKTAEYNLAHAMTQNQADRMSAIQDAKRQKKQLLTASQAELDRLLEGSAFSREQMIAQVDNDLNTTLAKLDESAAALRVSAEDGAKQMQYELSQSIQDLIERQYTTGVNRSVAEGQIYLQHLNDQPTKVSAWDAAGGYTAQVLKNLGLNQGFATTILGDVTDWFSEGRIMSVDSFHQWLQTDEGRKANLSPEEINIYEHAINAFGQGLVQYEDTYGALDTNFNPIYIAPLQGYTLSSMWGTRNDSVTGEPEFHHGIDLVAPRGTPVVAIRGGVVERYSNADAGNAIRIYHDDGTVSQYAHLDGWLATLNTGDRVHAGDLIGNVGKTGNARAYHLHFAFLVGGQYVDPVQFGVFKPNATTSSLSGANPPTFRFIPTVIQPYVPPNIDNTRNLQ
jgi:murein DD-endopeptidase MepM/ murein hydrolase activator NlpD